MIVYIEWEDAWTHRGWADKSELADGLSLVKTVGFLVDETDDIVRVALLYCDNNENYGYVTSIPRANIKKYLEIEIKGGL